MAIDKNDAAGVRQALTQAVALQRAGQLPAAQALCGQVLTSDPLNGIALHLQGVLLTQVGHYEAAIQSLDLAIQHSPPSAALHSNRGIALKKAERFMEAVKDFEIAISIQPNHAEAHNNRGSALLSVGIVDKAKKSFEQAIAIRPEFALAHLNLARTLRQLERTADAALSFNRALEIQPNMTECLEEFGLMLSDCTLFEDALPILKRAVALKPDDFKLANSLGLAFHRSGDLNEAARWYEKSHLLNTEAADPLSNLGAVLSEQGNFSAAISHFDLAIQRRSDFPDAILNRAITLQGAGDLSAALSGFEHAIAVNPDDPRPRLFRAYALFLLGRYRAGWKDHELRWNINRNLRRRDFRQPLWLGSEPLGGCTILLHFEQGHGDTLQFCRYVPLVVGLGARVLLAVPNSLFRLMQETFERPYQGNFAQVSVILAGKTLPDFDYHCPLMSLPLAFNTELESIPCSKAYLSVDDSRTETWANRLGSRQRLRVGLVWSGGFRPDQPECWLVNERRNLPLNKLEPLRAVTADFYSLQKGEPAVGEFKRQLADGWNGPAMIDLTDDLDDFAETAALIANLDLVISVDTSTAHLAAAIGKPVWILNRFDTCWRWMLDRRDSPWYPTVTLYRQSKPGQWDDVIEQVRKDLEAAALKYETEGIEAIDWGPPPSAKAPVQIESRPG